MFLQKFSYSKPVLVYSLLLGLAYLGSERSLWMTPLVEPNSTTAGLRDVPTIVPAPVKKVFGNP